MKQIIEYFKTIGVDANTTATIFITLFTFFLGYIVTWIAGQIKEGRTRGSYRKVFLTILRDFSKSCKEQHKSVTDSLSKSINYETEGSLILKFNPITTLDYLNKLDYHLFLESFQPVFGQKKFTKISSTLFTLIATTREQNNVFEEFVPNQIAELKILINDFMNGAKELRNIFDQVCLVIKTDSTQYMYGKKWYDGYLKIFSDFESTNKPHNSYNFNINIAEKVVDLNNSALDIQLAVDAGKYARQCMVAQGQMKSREFSIRQRFTRFAWSHRWAHKMSSIIIKCLE